MWLIFILIALVSFQFMAIFLLRMRIELLKGTVQKHSFCFRLFSCGRIKDKEAFMNEYNIGALGPNEILLSTILEAKENKRKATMMKFTLN